MATCALFLVGYDIANPKIQAQIRQFTKNHAIDGQKSAYECWLTPSEKSQLIADFTEIIVPHHDAVCIISIQSCHWQNSPKKHPLYAPTSNFLYIG